VQITQGICFELRKRWIASMSENETITLQDGRTLGYAEYGDHKGKPVIYFHGWPSSRLQSKLADKKAKRKHVRLIAVDRPGFGLSTYQEGRTMLDWPDDVATLADALHIKKFAVLGVSGGGPYAAAVAYKIPNRLTKVGIAVGLGPTWIPGSLDGISLTARFEWGNYARYPWLRFLAGFYYFIAARYLPLLFYANGFLTRSKADKQASYQLVRDHKKHAFVNHKETFRQGRKGPTLDLYLYTKDWGFDLQDITANVYLYYGDADKNVSLNMGKYYHEQISKSTLTIYPNEGHLSAITHQEEMLEQLSRELG
jgi:pimeloyl-ACP methyl ester carboxylesterase